jgi:hypothetical protein
MSSMSDIDDYTDYDTTNEGALLLIASAFTVVLIILLSILVLS